jgi:hypothetical protein
MNGRMRTSILAGAVVTVCCGLILMEPKEAPVPSREEVAATGVPQQLPEEGDSAARLDQQGAVVRARIEFTRRVALQLIAQRLSLIEAAHQLRDLDHSLAPGRPDIYHVTFLKLYPGQSEDERYCQRAIHVVEGELASEPVQRRAITQHLMDELRQELQRGVLRVSQ